MDSPGRLMLDTNNDLKRCLWGLESIPEAETGCGLKVLAPVRAGAACSPLTVSLLGMLFLERK